MNRVISSLDLSNPVDVSFLKNLSAASARVSAKNTKSELRDTGLVSILTSDTPYQIRLPSQDYLRLKRLQKTVRVTAEVVEEKIKAFNQRMKPAMVTLTYRPDVDWSPSMFLITFSVLKSGLKERVFLFIIFGLWN